MTPTQRKRMVKRGQKAIKDERRRMVEALEEYGVEGAPELSDPRLRKKYFEMQKNMRRIYDERTNRFKMTNTERNRVKSLRRKRRLAA